MRLNTSVTNPEVGFLSASLCLRPPRIAILVRDDEHWRDWVMRALSTASDYWGGGGFVLIPFDVNSGDVDPSFAEIVRAYDPDHVVSLGIPWSVWEEHYPGDIKVDGVRDEAQRLELIATAHMDWHDDAARRARHLVVSWCSPMRADRLGQDDEPRALEVVRSLKRRDKNDRWGQGLPPIPFSGGGSRLAAAAHWRSDVGLYAALKLGVADTEPEERAEPNIDSLSWLIWSTRDAPGELMWTDEDVPPATTFGLESWFVGGQDLVSVSRGLLRDRGVVVVGDTLRDFTLALAYDRLIGGAIWLTPDVIADETLFKGYVQPSVRMVISELESGAARMVVTSSSASSDYLDELILRLHRPDIVVSDSEGRTVDLPERNTVKIRLPEIDKGLRGFVVNDHVGASVSLPVAKFPDDSMEALVGLETPIPGNLLYPNNPGRLPYWYVDITFDSVATPAGRDVPNGALVTERGPFPEVNLRASRDGISFDPRSMGFVSSGAFLPSRIGKPRLRNLSMSAWVEAMAEADGLGVRISSPGRRAELVRARLGNRRDLLELATDLNLSMLSAFVPLKKAPVLRDENAVVLGLDPYLSFEKIDALLGGVENETVRLVDRLTEARLLRRGLILNCVECGRPSFVDADRLGQRFECPQCVAMNSLISARWKKTTEPRWFYDLYATFRELLKDRGDLVLRAAAKLERSSRTYVDTPELEFFDLGTGTPIAEIDVIASVDRKVILVEAKAGASFTPRKRAGQIDKLLRLAQALRADGVQLATDKASWNDGDVSKLTERALDLAPFAPTIEVVTLP